MSFSRLSAVFLIAWLIFWFVVGHDLRVDVESGGQFWYQEVLLSGLFGLWVAAAFEGVAWAVGAGVPTLRRLSGRPA